MKLLEPYNLGGLPLKNRMAMAPMTRSRALEGNVANPLTATYYAQRASAGLLITEGTQVSPQGVGYIRTPGIHSPEQVAAWKVVTDAVHAAGGVIFAQLWHVGRVSHSSFHNGELPVSASAIAAEGQVYTWEGPKDMETPRALETSEIPGIIEQFRKGAENAKLAGFDGIEFHGANGYLLDQFLRDGSNHRTDNYGGSIENRARLILEIVDAALTVWEPGRIGYKISPNGNTNSMSDSNTLATFTYLAQELSKRNIAYMDVAEAVGGPFGAVPEEKRITPALRKAFTGTLIANVGYTAETGNAAIESGLADMIAYGSGFLANPDLPERFKTNAPLNAPIRDTFYQGEEKGYIDYPTLAEQVTQEA